MLVRILVFFLGIEICYGKVLKMVNNITEQELDRLPILFHLDDFDKCLRIKEETLYCYATIQLSPHDIINPSEIWKTIEEVISLPRNYRHDRLRHGICIPESCPDILKQYYAVGNGTKELLEGISKCYSDKYKTVGLKGVVTKIHCENETPIYEIDNVDKLYAFVILSLLGLVIISSFYEGFARFSTPEKYRQLTESSTFGRILSCFSLPKNWDRLTSEINSSDGLALAPIQGIRVFNMYLVILGHSVLFCSAIPTINPIFIEDLLLKPIGSIAANGALICDTNLIITNFLIAYSVVSNYEKKKFKLRNAVGILFNRIIRTVPVILLVIGFGATWMRHIARGPFWAQVVDSEYRNCRKNWLLNTFFLNNYINSEEMCLEQTWYSAADIQGCIVSLLVMMYVMKKPEQANKIFGLSILFGAMITFIHQYYGQYDIVFRTWPETLHKFLLDNLEFQQLYIPGHQHLISCFLGLACGFYYYKYRNDDFPFMKRKLSSVLLVVYFFAGTVGTILSAYTFYKHGYEQTRFGAALYQSMVKLSFGLPVTVLLFAFAMKSGGIMRSVCNWKPMHVLGRLSLCAFLGHTIPMRIKGGVLRTSMHVSYYTIFNNNVSDFLVAYLVAVIICLCFEMPLSALIKVFSSTNKEKSNKKIK